MLLTTKALTVGTPLAGLLLAISANASPYPSDIDVSNFGLTRRLDDGSGVAADDDDPNDINTDNTRPLRDALDARSVYTSQPTATWYQVDVAASDVAASFTSFQTTLPSTSPIPPPNDTNQFTPTNPWNVDHIFELQVITEAFAAKKPDNIPAADWSAASSAVNTKGDPNAAIATAVTNLNNLQGIPNSLNSFKKQVFRGILTGGGFPSVGDGATYFNFFGPAIRKYLEAAQAGLMAGTVDETGNKIQSAANNNADVKAYFTSYASSQYQGCIDYLSTTWSGKSTTRATSTSAAAAAATSTVNVVPVPAKTTAPAILGPCPTPPSGGWPDYGVCMSTCQPSYMCVQFLGSDPATWQCSC